ncbi:MAG: 2Fe-2S iron-sulfur cluster binding domain-containing protein [Armatimonadetes bacterium]|nr:2Fe-2S iron-sulfur cluster binding domain-containing protein [Armatimonadota bacterium]
MQTYRVTFKKSGRSIDVPENGIVLEWGLRAGLDITYGCQGGSCGTCMVRVEGEVFQWGRAIDEEEMAQGYALICSSYPRSDLVIDG